MAELIALVEAVYRPDYCARSWVQGVVRALEAEVAEAAAVAAFLLDDSAPPVLVTHCASDGVPPGLLGVMREQVLTSPPRAGAELVASSALASGMGSVPVEPDATARACGMHEVVEVAASHPSGVRMVLFLLADRPLARTSAVKRRLLRVADHLRAGLCLRELQGAAPWRGRKPEYGVSTCAAERRGVARSELRSHAVAAEQACTGDAGRGADDGEAAWEALVAGAWSVVDSFDNHGRRYLLARRTVPLHAPRLTMRQCEALSLRAAGHSLKIIAAELGVSVSTIACDLSVAMQTLGLRNATEVTSYPFDSTSRESAAQESH